VGSGCHRKKDKRKRVLDVGLLGWVGLMGLLGRRVGFMENWPE
jgi:hypothetical protein